MGAGQQGWGGRLHLSERDESSSRRDDISCAAWRTFDLAAQPARIHGNSKAVVSGCHGDDPARGGVVALSYSVSLLFDWVGGDSVCYDSALLQCTGGQRQTHTRTHAHADRDGV